MVFTILFSKYGYCDQLDMQMIFLLQRSMFLFDFICIFLYMKKLFVLGRVVLYRMVSCCINIYDCSYLCIHSTFTVLIKCKKMLLCLFLKTGKKCVIQHSHCNRQAILNFTYQGANSVVTLLRMLCLSALRCDDM